MSYFLGDGSRSSRWFNTPYVGRHFSWYGGRNKPSRSFSTDSKLKLGSQQSLGSFEEHTTERLSQSGGNSAPCVRSWLTQVASEYERLEDDSRVLKEENSRLRSRLQQMEDFALAAKEHDSQMEVGDAVEARLMTPSRLPPLRASDFGVGLSQESVYSSAVSWLERSRNSILGTEVGDMAQTSERRDSPYATEDGMPGDEDPSNPLFPTWFSPGTDDDKRFEESASMKAEAEIEMWLQQMEARETVHNALVFSPVGKFRIVWDCIWFMVLAYDIWVLCFTCAFMANSCSFVMTYNMISSFLVIDICLNFVTGSIEGERIIWEHRQIAQAYLRSWFWIDVLAAIPISTICCFLESQNIQLGKDRLGEGSLRFARALRVLKFVRLIRIVKVVVLGSAFRHRYQRDYRHHSKDGAHNWYTQKHRYDTNLSRLFARTNHVLIRYTTQIRAVIYTAVLLAVLTHVQGCIWGSWHPAWGSNQDVHVAFERYCQSLWWAYTTLIDGNPPAGEGRMHFLETVMATERVVLQLLAAMWIVFQGLLMCDEDAHLMLNKADALEYLQRRGVSTDTQIQLQNSFSETRRARKLQRRFEALVDKEVSRELRHMIYIEMWGSKLVSLGLINEMSHWHEDFLCRLTESVYEEAHGAKAVVCKAGDWATIAYLVLEGLIHIISDLDKEGPGIPDFSPGMWVGEKALVSSGFRRSNSIVASSTSTLMVVHSNAFHALIDELNLRERFQFFCTDELWKGMCGRCGEMGDHFTDECPHMHGCLPNCNRKEKLHPISRDLRMFIVESHLEFVLPALSIMGISTLEDLETADIKELETFVEKDLGKELSPSERQNLSRASIQSFKERTRGATKSIMNTGSDRNIHFIFLSHYKLEAGTEASLMRFELEQKLSMDQSGHFDGMEAPVFLDSEDLQNLKDLQERVRNSHNIALILTQGVLTRPWVLIEIVTAYQAGIHILPVQVAKPGNDFQYPKEEFFQSLANGEIVDESGIQMILDSGFTLQNVATAVQNTFKRIAVTYSPHRPATIRQSELDEFLRHCRYRSTLAGAGQAKSTQQSRRAVDPEARRLSMDMTMGRLDSEAAPTLREARARNTARKTPSEAPSKPGLMRSQTLINIIPADESRPLLS